MDTANETISSSSQQQCSLRCAKDATCTGLNIKNQLTCDIYNYKPKFVALVVACMFLEVGYTGWPKKTSRILRNYNGGYTLWGEISFGTFVDQYVL